MSKKLIIVIVIAVIVIGFIIYRAFIKDNGVEYVLEKASIGTVIREVAETGTVKISEEINLSFKNAGRIDEIYVKVGDEVEAGQRLPRRAWSLRRVSRSQDCDPRRGRGAFLRSRRVPPGLSCQTRRLLRPARRLDCPVAPLALTFDPASRPPAIFGCPW